MIDYMMSNHAWARVKACARTTIGKDGEGLPPDDSWKKRMLLAEHSPIRRLQFSWKWSGLKSWVSTHFVRHKIGIEHWVSTQRSDRTGVPRDEKLQNAPVDHECEANAQAMINISRKRLCNQASPETREAWREVLKRLETLDPVLASVCVPECVYRGFCPEMNPCGYADTEDYRKRLAEYRRTGQ